MLGLLLAGCSATQERFETTLTSPNGTDAISVSVWDRTDLVESIAPAPGNPLAGITATVSAGSADGNALVVSWLGGACEVTAEIGFWRAGEGYRLSMVHEARSAPEGQCSAGGIERAIRITLSSPISPEQVTVQGSATP